MRYLMMPFAVIASIIVLPAIIFREVIILMSFFIFLLWRSYTANRILQKHGPDARSYFLKRLPADYRQFIGGYNG